MIGEKIREIRKCRKMTQIEFANFLDVGVATIRRYENSSRQPDYSFLEKLINQLKINPMWLFADDSIMVLNDEIERPILPEKTMETLKSLNESLSKIIETSKVLTQVNDEI